MSSFQLTNAFAQSQRESAASFAPFFLICLTVLAVCVHGYHLGSDDSAIYIPAIKRIADPSLYPFGSEFFQNHAHLSLFPDLVALTARVTRFPIDAVIFGWYLAGILLLLTAAWQLSSLCFLNRAARWAGVALLGAFLTVPVAGTALVVMDPYLTARSLSTPASLFSVASYVGGKRGLAGLWLFITALIHPQMALYVAAFLACTSVLSGSRFHLFSSLPLFPQIFNLQPPTGAAREALRSRTFFFVFQWEWFEWLGVFAPLALCWWLSRSAVRGTTPAFRLLARTIVPFGFGFTAAGIVLSSSERLENFARLQPMRAFHLVYLVLFVLLGGVLGEYVLRRPWIWLALFLPVLSGLWLVQRDTYSHSPSIEWPGVTKGNSWTAAFYWIRQNTPKSALFALDPGYMSRRGEDMHGFRAIAERSVLADEVKDSGAVSLFPDLAPQWKQQVEAQRGLETFHSEDFDRLVKLYSVTWVITGGNPPARLACPYSDGGVSVCRIPSSGLENK